MTFEDDLLALERRVLEEAGGDFFRAVADLRRRLAAESGGIARRLEELALPALEQAAQQGTLDGWNLGGQRAITDAGTARRVDPNTLDDADLRLLTPPAHLTDPFTGLDALLTDAKTRSAALLRSGADEQTAAAPIFQAATTARSRIVTQINAASNAAAVEVGDATRSPMVWEAERDGCVFCLALAGEVVERAGDPFPDPDLYAPVPASMTTKSAPPLHPHCRCRLAVLVSREYADALKREAQRSILRGHSLASESEAVRLRAAARLLERDPVAPKTVKAFAAAAVKRGRFPTRDVPVGDPRLIIERAGPSKGPPAGPPKSAPPSTGSPHVDTFLAKLAGPGVDIDDQRAALEGIAKSGASATDRKAARDRIAAALKAAGIKLTSLQVAKTNEVKLGGTFRAKTVAEAKEAYAKAKAKGKSAPVKPTKPAPAPIVEPTPLPAVVEDVSEPPPAPQPPPPPEPKPERPAKKPKKPAESPASADALEFKNDAARKAFRDSMTFVPKTFEEVDVVKGYTSAASYGIARVLRGDITWAENTYASGKRILKGMDDMMAKSRTTRDAIVYRGAPLGALRGIDLDNAVGKVISDPHFLSTSMTRGVHKNFASKVAMRITVPKGTHALYIGEKSSYKEEKELLLNRGARLVITSLERDKDGIVHIEAEVLPEG